MQSTSISNIRINGKAIMGIPLHRGLHFSLGLGSKVKNNQQMKNSVVLQKAVICQ